MNHDPEERRLRRAAIAAIAVHVALAGLVARDRVLASSRSTAPPAAPAEIEVAIEAPPPSAATEMAPASATEATREPAPKREPESASPAARVESVSAASESPSHAAESASPAASSRLASPAPPESASLAPSASAVASSGGSPASAASAGAPASSASGEASSGVLGRHLSLAELGIAGPNAFVGTAAEAMREPTRAEQSERLERAIMAPILAHDSAMGLGPSGPVVSALEEATYVGASSKRGMARFQARTDVNGFVVEVVVLEVDGDRAAWEGVAREALGALRGRVLRVPSRRKSVAMTIEITSAWQLPSGRDPGVEVRVAGIPVKRGEGSKSTAVEIIGLPKVTVAPPSADTTGGVRLPDVRLEVPILRLDGDPSDLGAKPRRIVHGKVLDEHLL